MKRYFKIALSSLAAAAFFTGTLLMPSCTSVDDTLGADLVQDGQQMVFAVDTITGINTFTTCSDSIPMHRLGYMTIGSMQTADFGTVTCSYMTQMLPEYNTGESWKFERQFIDSVTLNLFIIDIRGDNTKEQTFRIYPVVNDMPRDKAYYSNTPLTDYADMSKPLFEFKMKNEVYGTFVQKKLTVLPDGDNLLNALVALPESAYSVNSSDDSGKEEFWANIKGFYFAPTSASPKDAAHYSMQTSYISDSDYNTYMTRFVINYHNHRDPVGGEVSHNHGGAPLVTTDTLKAVYNFDDIDSPFLMHNMSYLHIEHDYTGMVMDRPTWVDPFDTTGVATATARPEAYVQGLMGVYTHLWLSDDFMSQLEALKTVDGVKYKTMNIHNAKLLVNMKNPTSANMDMAPSRLGLYTRYSGRYPFTLQRLSSWTTYFTDYVEYAYGAPVAVADYSYLTEYEASNYFGGTLNRNHGRYDMDISLYFRDFANSKYVTRNLWLAPAMSLATTTVPKEVILRGTPGAGATQQDISEQPRVVVTYTLIK